MARSTNPDWSLSKSLSLLGKLLFVITLLVGMVISVFTFLIKASKAKDTPPAIPSINITINNLPPDSQGHGRGGNRSKKACACSYPETAANCNATAHGAEAVKEDAGRVTAAGETVASSEGEKTGDTQSNQASAEKSCASPSHSPSSGG